MARRAGIKLTTSAGTSCEDGRRECGKLDGGGATGFGKAQLNTLCGVGVHHHRQSTGTRITHPQQQLQNKHKIN